MIQKDKTYNLATFFCLYIAQTIPMSFFSTVIPVMMRQENFSLSAIGLLQLIKLPWILKFLWSPMVDRHAVTTGDYKRWIFSSELIYAGLIFAVAFLDFHTDFYRRPDHRFLRRFRHAGYRDRRVGGTRFQPEG